MAEVASDPRIRREPSRRRQLVALAGGGAFLVILVSAGLVLAPGWFARSGEDYDCGCLFTLDRMVAEADFILVATLGESREGRVPAAWDADGKVIGERRDRVWMMQVDDTLKGEPGETPSELREAISLGLPTVELNEGVRYLLFLRRASDGGVARNGEASLATVQEGGSLEFLLPDRSAEAAPVYCPTTGGDPAPFTATLEDVRAEVARQAAEPGIVTHTIIEWVTYYNAPDLLARSTRIVVATYLDSSTREIDLVSEGSGLPTGDTRTDVIQRFEVVETLKGPASPGKVQEAGSTCVEHQAAREGRRPANDVTFEVLSPVEGQEYVLFLRDARDPQDPGLRWTFAGQPRAAVAGEDGTLRFLLTRDIEEELRASGKSSLFTATLDDIRAEIARQGSPTPTSP